jgi:hypothetical protein
VEISWRGKLDYHCTMASRSAPGVTRFGTSVQLTGKGTAAVARFWAAGGEVAQATTPADRIVTATNALGARDRKVLESEGKGQVGAIV